jgi:hypothetical protein
MKKTLRAAVTISLLVVAFPASADPYAPRGAVTYHLYEPFNFIFGPWLPPHQWFYGGYPGSRVCRPPGTPPYRVPVPVAVCGEPPQKLRIIRSSQ